MYKHFIILLISVLYINFDSQSQTPFHVNFSFLNIYSSANKKPIPDKPKYDHVFSIYPGRALTNYMMVGYDKKISPSKSVKIIAGYAYYTEYAGISNRNFSLYGNSGFRFEAQFKSYLSKDSKVFNGWYIGPTVGFKQSNFEIYKGTKSSASATMIGVIIGYQFPLGKLFIGDIYFGEALKKAYGDYESVDRGLDGYKNGVGFHTGFNIGFGF